MLADNLIRICVFGYVFAQPFVVYLASIVWSGYLFLLSYQYFRYYDNNFCKHAYVTALFDSYDRDGKVTVGLSIPPAFLQLQNSSRMNEASTGQRRHFPFGISGQSANAYMHEKDGEKVLIFAVCCPLGSFVKYTATPY